MITLPSLEWATVFAFSLAVRSTALLLLATGAQRLLGRRASAATRHLVWTLSVVSLLALPLLTVAAPHWKVLPPVAPVLPAAGRVATAPLPAVARPAAVGGGSGRPVPWTGAVAMVYLAGALLLLARLGVERWAIRRLTAETPRLEQTEWTRLLRELQAELGLERPVVLLRGPDGAMPMTWGTRRPAILVPGGAERWTEERRRAVLLHELAHVARRDCLVQLLAAVAGAVYWLHPGVGWARRRLRLERELACDDRVLMSGVRPGEYATHLLEIARELRPVSSGSIALAMARPSQLETRIRAVMDAARSRSGPAGGTRLAASWVTAAVLVAIATAGVAETRVLSRVTPSIGLAGPARALPRAASAVIQAAAPVLIGVPAAESIRSPEAGDADAAAPLPSAPSSPPAAEGDSVPPGMAKLPVLEARGPVPGEVAPLRPLSLAATPALRTPPDPPTCGYTMIGVFRFPGFPPTERMARNLGADRIIGVTEDLSARRDFYGRITSRTYTGMGIRFWDRAAVDHPRCALL